MNEVARTFECPSCGASLQPPAGAATMQCAYCGTSVVVPQDLRASPATNPAGAAPASLDFAQLMGEAIRMGQVVRLARGGMQAEALQLYRQNTGVEAGQAEKVIQAIIAGNAPNPAMMGNEMASVGAAIASMRTTREMEMEARARRSRRTGGIGCSGTIALLIVAAVLIVAIQHSTGTAHDLLARLIAQLNLSGLIH